MPTRLFKISARRMALSGSVLAVLIALLTLWLGNRHDLQLDRLASEGKLARGEYVSTRSGSRSEGRPDEIMVRYRVNGVEYFKTMYGSTPNSSEPIFEAELIKLPRLGKEELYDVVYMPSDPSHARLREDMTRAHIAVYGTAGMFLFVGLVFGAVGIFVFGRSNSDPLSLPPS